MAFFGLKIHDFFFIFLLIFTISIFQLEYGRESRKIDPERKLERKINNLERKLIAQEERLRNLTEEMINLMKSAESTEFRWKEPIPVLVFACNRATSLRLHVKKLLKFRKDAEKFPIFISQDCDDWQVEREAKRFGDSVNYIKHSPGETANITIEKKQWRMRKYWYISRHYKLGLSHIFGKMNFSTVIITEDDLDIAPDFFSYFSNTRYLLEKDPNLWCVTAWNDNGKSENIDSNSPATLYRSDFFGGLGWMMSRKTWLELEPKWPLTFWDDWLREPVQRKNRQCIRPEISRTGMMKYGKNGASSGLFYNEFLSKIKVNEVFTDFSQIDLNYLLPDRFNASFNRQVLVDSEDVKFEDVEEYLKTSENRGSEIRVAYTGEEGFVEIANFFGLMSDTKAGIPRTAYNGIVTLFRNGTRIFLVPNHSV